MWEVTSIYRLEVDTKKELILWSIMMSQSISIKLKSIDRPKLIN